MMKKILTRLKNKKVIVAIVSGILMILVNLGLIDVGMSEKITEIVNIVLGLLITVGIIGNPESHVNKDEA